MSKTSVVEVQLKDINDMGWEKLSVAVSFGALAIWWESNHSSVSKFNSDKRVHPSQTYISHMD